MAVTEAVAAATPMGSALHAGLDTLDLNQTVQFAQYTRYVLPVDGFVFWIKTGITTAFQGSLHYGTIIKQEEDENAAYNQIVFTAKEEIQDFEVTNPSTIWVGSIGAIRFAFGRRAPYYEQAGLFHYTGDALNASDEQQLIDDPANFDYTSAVITNSLPIWLTMMGVTNATVGLNGIGTPLFPSMLSPQNEQAPYATIHIDPRSTEAMQIAPWVQTDGTQQQLCQERVRITMFGLRAEQALGFLAYIQQFALFTESIGFLNLPTIKEDKRPNPEMGFLTNKKFIEFDVNYNQAAAASYAQQLIASALLAATPS